MEKYRLTLEEMKEVISAHPNDPSLADFIFDAQSAKAARLATAELQAENAALKAEVGNLENEKGMQHTEMLLKDRQNAALRDALQKLHNLIATCQIGGVLLRAIYPTVDNVLSEARALLSGDAEAKE